MAFQIYFNLYFITFLCACIFQCLAIICMPLFILQIFHLLISVYVPVLKAGKLTVNKIHRSHGNGYAHTSIKSRVLWVLH